MVILPLPDEPLTRSRPRGRSTRIIADVAATDGFSEVHYDAAGAPPVPVLAAAAPSGTAGADAARRRSARDDVLLVTGGGKGITAECALALGRQTGARVGILGRSDPAADAELAANLERMRQAGVSFHYVRADVTALDEVQGGRRTRSAGRWDRSPRCCTAPGRNEPQSLTNLDEASFRRTLAPKIAGLEAVLAATDPGTAEAAGHLRQHHRPRRPARRGGLRHRQRLARPT